MGIRAAFIFFVTVLMVPVTFGQNVRPLVRKASSDDLAPIQQDGKWGYADKNGKVVIKPQFSLASKFSEGLALVWIGGVPLTDPVVKSFVKMGYIDTRGHWVIHSRFEYYFFDDFSDGFVAFRRQSSKWGYMDRAGKIAIRPQFDWAGSFSSGVAPVLLDSKCAHVDKTGKIMDQSETVLPRRSGEQDSHGTFLVEPRHHACS